MKIITNTQAEKLFNIVPSDFYTYYCHVVDNGKTIIRRDDKLFLCDSNEEAIEVANCSDKELEEVINKI